ncbi:hypothetical protein [Ulvibacterium marinum]|uniref:DUF2764 family protein n=1 Tax=Ulvibacterium marinum TaxID=2419782 RepID=A0A3B0C0S6_9FLAO|nr:hypothetical protein [Ulvibacterium marinum]RKN79675.1 hypothetical protein D7Z94_15380 [Ulvibacterium marinum]
MITGNLEYVMSSFPHLYFQDSDEERLRVFSILRKYAGPSGEEKSIIAILDEEAGNYLTSRASRTLQQITLEDIHKEIFQRSKNKILSAFSTYVHRLKSDIEQLRVSRKKRVDATMAKKQPLPLTLGTPLEEEIQILKMQWDKLDGLSIGHYTDFGALIIYKLKLLLLLRWWSFDQKVGFDNFLHITKKD